jgi:hypothetical protein
MILTIKYKDGTFERVDVSEYITLDGWLRYTTSIKQCGQTHQTRNIPSHLIKEAYTG